MPRDSGRPSSRRSSRDDPDEEVEERPRRGRRDEPDEEEAAPLRRGAKKDNTMILVGVFGTILLVIIGIVLFVIPSVNKGREDQIRKQKEEFDAAVARNAAKAKAADDEAVRRKKEKEDREGPWKLALEKVLPGLKRFMEKDNRMKHLFGTFGFENDRPEYYFTVRAPFTSDPRADIEEAIQKLAEKLTELGEAGFENAEAKKMPMREKGPPIIHFMKDIPQGKKSKDGTEVATYTGTAIAWK